MENNLRSFIKKNSDPIVISLLIILGLLLFYFSASSPRQSSGWFQTKDILISLGTTAIVSAFAWAILSQGRAVIQQVLQNTSEELNKQAQRIETLSRESQIVNEARESGISHIYRDRGTTDVEYENSLIEHFRKVPEGATVKIIGVTLSRFFGPKYNSAISTPFFEMLSRNVNVQILILDPRSIPARYRASIDQRQLIQEHGYIASSILTETYDVIRRLKHPTPDWCIQEGLIDQIKNQIKVRLYDFNPVLHLIILDKYIYIEQYHNGGGKYVRNILKENERYSNLPDYTGFVPVFKVKKESLYGQLMISHFDNIWESEFAQNHALKDDNVYHELFDFVEKEWEKRDENGCL